jgi:NADPH:quinone reductase-like Zn-dependent oxidoreductase
MRQLDARVLSQQAAMPATGRAFVYRRNGDPVDVLELFTVELPTQLRPQDVLVRMTHVPIHPVDLIAISDPSCVEDGPVFPTEGRTPGHEGAGVIEAIGDGVVAVFGLHVGARVAVFPMRGSWKEWAVVPAASVVPLSDDIPSPIAAQMFVASVTANAVLNAVRRSTPAEIPGLIILLQSGAASLPGRLITLLAEEAGYLPIRLTDSRQAADALRDRLSGPPVIATEDSDWRDQVRRASMGLPILMAAEEPGGPPVEVWSDLLTAGGTVTCYGLRCELVGAHRRAGGAASRQERGLRWLRGSQAERAAEIALALRLAAGASEQFAVAADYRPEEFIAAVWHARRRRVDGTVLLTFPRAGERTE